MRTGQAVGAFIGSMAKTTRMGLVSAMRLRSSALMNGAVAGLGVAGAALLSAILAPQHASAILLGAICVSIADTPTSLMEKLKRIGLAWILSLLALLAAACAAGAGAVEALVVMAAGFCAGMVTAFGRNAIPISVAVLLTLALAGSADPPGVSALSAALWFGVGGFFYAVYAAISTHLLMRRTKRMLLQEALQGLADYLRAQKAALEEGADRRGVYAMLIASQAMLAERIQAARNVVFVGMSSPHDRQIAAELLVAIDIFEAALSEQADLDTLLELGGEGDEALQALRGLLLIAASDLDRLSRALVDPAVRDFAPIGDRHALLATITALQGRSESDRSHVLGATRNKLDGLFTQIERLAKAQSDPEIGPSVIGAIDLGPFVQRSVFDPRSVARELNLQSPVARFAIRLSLAMFCGSLIGEMLPYRAHGSWILLTVALVMRANYSVTRQRRDERLLGNVIGCVFAAIALSVAPAWLIPLIVFVAVGFAHAFALQSYLVASIASCVMALMLIHPAQPNESIFLFMRVVDTAIGGGIAYGFSFFLPYWEYQTIAQLAPDLLRAELDCARQALAVDSPDQAYRLARRRLFDAIAALSTAVSRMLEEPASARYEPRALSEFLAAGYVFAAELASVRVFVRNRADLRDARLAAAIERTRHAVERRLTGVGPALASADGELSDVDAEPLDANPLKDSHLVLFARRLRHVTEVADRLSVLARRAELNKQASA